MNTEIAVILFYKGSGFGSAPELKWDDFENLKSYLRENYITNFKDTGGPQAGGILDTIVEILQKQVLNLKKKLEDEREEHRSIYAKVKEENEYLREQLNIKS